EVEDDDVQQALDLLADWDGQNDPDSSGAAFANVLWNHVTFQMMRSQDATIPRSNQSRFVEFFKQQLESPDSQWWADSQEELLKDAAAAAYEELTDEQGSDMDQWSWGELHALPLTHESFGTSGIAPIEALFNRGPYPVGGGSGVVNATGWDLDVSYATDTVPSMRMVVDLDEWDHSTWQNLTGASGHAFHDNYTDQTEAWAKGQQYTWYHSTPAVDDATKETLTLQPADTDTKSGFIRPINQTLGRVIPAERLHRLLGPSLYLVEAHMRFFISAWLCRESIDQSVWPGHWYGHCPAQCRGYAQEQRLRHQHWAKYD